MNPLDFPLLVDENIHPDVVRALTALGKDVVSVLDHGLGGHSDRDVLAKAVETGRVVLTHDSDFGGLVVRDGRVLGVGERDEGAGVDKERLHS